MKSISLAEALALHVIALTIKDHRTPNGRTVYVAVQEREWDGSWYTSDLSRAKTYKLRRNAEKRITEHCWEDMAPRVLQKSEIVTA